jgi:hypothetical protein
MHYSYCRKALCRNRTRYLFAYYSSRRHFEESTMQRIIRTCYLALPLLIFACGDSNTHTDRRSLHAASTSPKAATTFGPLLELDKKTMRIQVGRSLALSPIRSHASKDNLFAFESSQIESSATWGGQGLSLSKAQIVEAHFRCAVPV